VIGKQQRQEDKDAGPRVDPGEFRSSLNMAQNASRPTYSRFTRSVTLRNGRSRMRVISF